MKLEPSKPEIFLSYNREDQGAVELLARQLREEGIEPWLDYKDWIWVSRNINGIRTAYDLCKIWLVCIGAKGLDPSLNTEIQTAIYSRDNGGAFYVIPVLLPGADREGLNNLPGLVESTQRVEFPESMDDEESFRHLLAAIQEACSKYDQFKNQNSAQSARPNHKEQPIKPARVIKKNILLPDIDWVEIPAGEFIYGEDSAKQTLTLDRFFISRYPITNCQYQTFIDAGSYSDDR